MPKFVQRDQSRLYLLPPDLRDWLPADDLAHFVVEAVERVAMSAFEVNERGTGSRRNISRRCHGSLCCRSRSTRSCRFDARNRSTSARAIASLVGK